MLQLNVCLTLKLGIAIFNIWRKSSLITLSALFLANIIWALSTSTEVVGADLLLNSRTGSVKGASSWLGEELALCILITGFGGSSIWPGFNLSSTNMFMTTSELSITALIPPLSKSIYKGNNRVDTLKYLWISKIPGNPLFFAPVWVVLLGRVIVCCCGQIFRKNNTPSLFQTPL